MDEKEKDVVRAHACSYHNKEGIRKSRICGCFFCLRLFFPKDITEWCDRRRTAICPHCGVDAIIYENDYYTLDKEFLLKMKKYWFY